MHAQVCQTCALFLPSLAAQEVRPGHAAPGVAGLLQGSEKHGEQRVGKDWACPMCIWGQQLWGVWWEGLLYFLLLTLPFWPLHPSHPPQSQVTAAVGGCGTNKHLALYPT